MGTLRFILGDQLTRDVSALRDLDKKSDIVLMVEVADETQYVPHHPQKIVFILSATSKIVRILKFFSSFIVFKTLYHSISSILLRVGRIIF